MILSTIVAATALLAGCAMNAPVGLVYTANTLPITATSNGTGMKTGMACSTSVLMLVAKGDNSIAAAKANGGIKQVTSVDMSVKNVLGVYGKYCTIVHGN